jgi:hypothetical protein
MLFRRIFERGSLHCRNSISSPTSVPVLPIVPAGSSRTPRAFQKTLEMRFLRNRSYFPSTRRSGPRNRASKSNRIPMEWMLLQGVSQSPSPGAGSSAPRSPRNRFKKVSASRMAPPMAIPRETFHALSNRAIRRLLFPFLVYPAGPHENVKTENHEEHDDPRHQSLHGRTPLCLRRPLILRRRETGS